jgi:hypothetical protein
MYVSNQFIYGHKLSIDPNLNDNVGHEVMNYSFTKEVNGKLFSVEEQYYGDGFDPYSILFGCRISDDNMIDYISDIRNAKESNYANDYREFLKFLKEDLKEKRKNNRDIRGVIDDLLEFIKTHDPMFYSIRVFL